MRPANSLNNRTRLAMFPLCRGTRNRSFTEAPIRHHFVKRPATRWTISGAMNKTLADVSLWMRDSWLEMVAGRSNVMRIARCNCQLLALVVAVALPVGSAFAQMSPELSFPTQKQQKQLTPEQQKYQKDLDESYKAANKKIPDQKPTDPWATMRSAPSASAPKTKQQ